jgi:hypothetical protein
MEEGLESTEVQEEKFKKDLKDVEVPRMIRECNNLLARTKDEKFGTMETNILEACNELENMEAEVQLIQQRAKDLNEYQEFLEVNTTDFVQAVELLETWRATKNLWHGLKNWIALSEKWVATKFSDIDVNEIQPIVDQYAKLVSVTNLDPLFSSSPVAKSLTEKVDTIQSTMPVVTSLRDNMMMKRHFDEIDEIIGQVLKRDDPDFTL